MSFRPRVRLPIPPRQVEDAIDDDTSTSEVVTRLLNLDPREAHQLMGKTTTTAYRRLHEVITSSIDIAIQQVERGGGELSAALLDMARNEVIIHYQQARGQISDAIAGLLLGIVRKLRDKIKETPTERKESLDKLRDALRRAMLILDSLAVLAYRYGGR